VLAIDNEAPGRDPDLRQRDGCEDIAHEITAS
jgi:hypothetical protein